MQHITDVAVGLSNTCRTSEQPKDRSELCVLGLGMQKIISSPPSPTCHKLSQGSGLPRSSSRALMRSSPSTARFPQQQLAWESRGAGARPMLPCVACQVADLGPRCITRRLWASQGTYRQRCRQLPAPPGGLRSAWAVRQCTGAACLLPAPPPGIMQPHAAGRGPTPRPTWSSPDSAMVTDRSLQPLSWHASSRGNVPFYRMSWALGRSGPLERLQRSQEPPCKRKRGFIAWVCVAAGTLGACTGRRAVELVGTFFHPRKVWLVLIGFFCVWLFVGFSFLLGR